MAPAAAEARAHRDHAHTQRPVQEQWTLRVAGELAPTSALWRRRHCVSSVGSVGDLAEAFCSGSGPRLSTEQPAACSQSAWHVLSPGWATREPEPRSSGAAGDQWVDHCPLPGGSMALRGENGHLQLQAEHPGLCSGKLCHSLLPSLPGPRQRCVPRGCHADMGLHAPCGHRRPPRGGSPLPQAGQSPSLHCRAREALWPTPRVLASPSASTTQWHAQGSEAPALAEAHAVLSIRPGAD